MLRAVDFTVLIVTHNRADTLRLTLRSLASCVTTATWEVLVVNNGSTDDTPRVVEQLAPTFPVPLACLDEPVLGKYGALNAGLPHAGGTYIAATDDDAIVASDWLETARTAFITFQADFVGGRVRPDWSAPAPAWLHENNPVFAKVLALQDHGDRVREYGVGISWPLGVNVAYRRDVFDRVGYFDPSLGRKAGTLRNQAQREWHIRAKAAGVRGIYVPDMLVYHRVTADRLTRQYFRRWYYWHGISRAILTDRLGTDLEEPEAEVTTSTRACGLPWTMIRKILRSGAAIGWRTSRLRFNDAFEEQLYLCFAAGVLRERLRRRGARAATRERAQIGEVQGQSGQPVH
jgi:glycosyltransferase involved in cell wall biosynthesis